MLIDLRSDTITRPTADMLEAMGKAPIGDDVFGDDPSVNQLEERVAKMFSHQAALFCPTATMANQIALALHCPPMSEVIAAEKSHIYLNEVGGFAYHARASLRPLSTKDGHLTQDIVEPALQEPDIHRAQTAVVCLENTFNFAGGTCADYEQTKTLCYWLKEKGIKTHLDGARLFNALAAQKQSPSSWGSLFDSLTLCFSKGLGCPMGATLVGPSSFIQKARKMRKLLGGGMRQVGLVAAAADYALNHHLPQLSLDHQLAQSIVDQMKKISWIEKIIYGGTNIIIIEVPKAQELVNQLLKSQIKSVALNTKQVRFVTHRDLPAETLSLLSQELHSYSR